MPSFLLHLHFFALTDTSLGNNLFKTHSILQLFDDAEDSNLPPPPPPAHDEFDVNKGNSLFQWSDL